MAGKVAESGSPTTFGSSPFLEIHVMPRKSVPSYRLHKPSGQARTIIGGRHVYLGKYNSPESRQRYARLIPVTYADIHGERWSYCQSKLDRISYKKTIGDAAVDGVVPEGNLRSPAQASKDLMTWLHRLMDGTAAG